MNEEYPPIPIDKNTWPKTTISIEKPRIASTHCIRSFEGNVVVI